MGLKEEILARLDQLISAGERVLATAVAVRVDDLDPTSPVMETTVDRGLFYQWRTSSLAFLRAKLGESSVHAEEFGKNVSNLYEFQTTLGIGILRAAREDVEGGYLVRVEGLVSADLFSNFLEMAKYLLSQGYKDPAASLIGAVLEVGLRRFCISNNVSLKSKENISSLNQKLADRGIYNRLRQKEIEVWNEVRDNADHGHFDSYSPTDVSNMVAGVQTLLAGIL